MFSEKYIIQRARERRPAIHHFEAALAVSSSFNQHNALFWSNYSLAKLFSDEDSFDDANAHIERAKSYAVMTHSAWVVRSGSRLTVGINKVEPKKRKPSAEALRALDVYKRLGVAKGVEVTRYVAPPRN